MRQTPTLKLSTRLVAFVTVIVMSAVFILFVGGTLSIKKMGNEYLNQHLSSITHIIDKELEDPDAAYLMQRWMPKMLQASNILEMELSSPAGVIYRYKNTAPLIDSHLAYSNTYRLERNEGYQVEFLVRPPYLDLRYSFGALGSVTLAVALIVFCLVRGVKWLKLQLIGSELLEERGRMILGGRVEQYAKGDVREWPYTASEALDILIEELQDARQERSRFDTFIRSQTFLDPLTGSANRVLFDSKLESALQESGANGAVLLFRIEDWDQVQEQVSKTVSDEFLVEVSEILSNVTQRYPDVIFSRYYESDFAIFIPHQGIKEVDHIATQAIRMLEKVITPRQLDENNWFHIGVSMYSEGEPHGRIMSEAETALKSAQLQKANGWNRFSKQASQMGDRGSVRWRTLFDHALQPDNILIFSQPCYWHEKGKDLKTLHREVFARIEDPERGIIKASRFHSALIQVGYQAHCDKAVLSKVFKEIKHSSDILPVSINLYVEPFANKNYFKWFRDELMQLPTSVRTLLSFEFPEARLVQHLDYIRPVVRMLSGLGCVVIVGQAGRSIVSTHYIKDLNIDYLKLHRSLIRKIDQRDENQLFVRSIVGACGDSPTEVIAVGVETKKEWYTLLDLGVNGGQGRYFAPEKQLMPKPKVKPTMIKPGRRNRWRKS
ncbi:RNase E specificity factor CsrD [Vibrio hippocampi]|uniref:RNase E specificity factor CsrD n=1 Tax=Vibrio hippocampi TaxID=654686 RepID=A0ABN8DGX5_9VIBR|nr:RNase E specificity factor CsrD [Vibrio hippocampi]CAH0526881.1 RNase E specificity factor CsrD [Vibrio hippocampi]